MNPLPLSAKSAKTIPFLVSAALLTLTGASLASGTFVTAIPIKPETLDPAATYDRYGNMIELNIYEPLVAFAGNSSRAGYVPALSAEVPSKDNGRISQDGRTYIFPLRKNVRFHDGSPLTAGDAAYSLIRFMISDAPAGPSGLFLKPIIGVNSIRDRDGNITPAFADFTKAVRADGDRVIITLKAPYPPFLALLASRPFITSQAWAAAHGEWDGTEATWKEFTGIPAEKSRIRYLADGTGPYKFESMDPESGRMTLVKNTDYWREPASLDRLVFAPVESESSRLSMLEAGDIDYAEFGPSRMHELSAMNNITVEEGLPGKSLLALSFNFSISTAVSNPLIGSGALDGKGVPADFFADAEVRKGFAYALNYDKLLSALWRAKARRITSPVPRESAPASPPFTFDKDAAERHFKNAFGGKLWEKGFDFSIPYLLNDPRSQEAGALIAESLKAVNPLFVVRPEPVSLADYIARTRVRQLPMFWSAFEPDYPAQYNYAFTMMDSDGLLPKSENYSNPKADKLCDEILLQDAPGREKALAGLDKVYAEDVPYILLFSADTFKAFRKGVTGVDSDNWLYSTNNLLDYYKVKKP